MKYSGVRRGRLLLWSLLAFSLIVPVWLIWSILPQEADPSEYFKLARGHLRAIDVEREWQDGPAVLRELTLRSDSGLNVKITTRVPQIKQGRKYPLLVILGGLRTGRDAVQHVAQLQGVMLAAISYPYHEDWIKQGIRQFDVRQYQQTAHNTVPAVLLTLDYLLAQEFIDRQQVELIGVSLGAFFVSMPAALDSRVTRTWIVHGAAEPEKVIAHKLRYKYKSKWIRWLLAKLSARLIAVEALRPEKWLWRISPRKLIFINARDDEAMPSASVTALHRSASQPYEVIWTEGQHVSTGRTEIIQQLVEIILQRVQRPQ